MRSHTQAQNLEDLFVNEISVLLLLLIFCWKSLNFSLGAGVVHSERDEEHNTSSHFNKQSRLSKKAVNTRNHDNVYQHPTSHTEYTRTAKYKWKWLWEWLHVPGVWMSMYTRRLTGRPRIWGLVWKTSRTWFRWLIQSFQSDWVSLKPPEPLGSGGFFVCSTFSPTFFLESSNGRTVGSEPISQGSNPCSRACAWIYLSVDMFGCMAPSSSG